MVTEMDSVATIFNYHRWMAIKWIWSLPSNLVAIVRWTCKNGEYDKHPFACFSHTQGWATFKNLVAIKPSQFLEWRLKFFNCQKKGHATCC